MSYTYTYSISLDFPEGKVNVQKLSDEIRASSIVTALDHIDTVSDAIYIVFKVELSAQDKTTLDGNQTHPAGGLIAQHDNTPSYDAVLIGGSLNGDGTVKSLSTDADGMLKATTFYPTGDKVYLHSVNWCDMCTWYETAPMVVEEILTDSGDGKTFNSIRPWWIDMTHGRMTDEDYLIEQAGPIDSYDHKKWVPIITVDDVEKVESFWDTADQDYQINYEAGQVIFHQSQVGKTVKATYWYAVSGTYTLAPTPGKRLQLVHVELQFSKNIVLRDTMIFQAYGYAGAFAPQLVDNVTIFPTTKIPIGKPTYYKRAFDFINEANGIYPITPPWGGAATSGTRGFEYEVLTFPWKYMTRTDLYSSYGMEIRVTMETNTVHDGELGTVTFYCVSTDEPTL